jgi:alkanesulfonate monooxygenase SsuD/methylene tetrahydromethanopterin reductase-like flavin-dependent oxidoreductase (luciferase family)
MWIGSWGSEAGLRRVARLGDGWLASAYNTTPDQVQSARSRLDSELKRRGKDPGDFPCSLATMWTYVTENESVRQKHLEALARMLNRPLETLAAQVLIGPPEACAAKIRAYQAAGVANLFIWPLADETRQLEIFASQVRPLL